MAYQIGEMVSSQEDISALFNNTVEDIEPEKDPNENKEGENTPSTEEKTVTEVTPEELFGEPERVGNEDNPGNEEVKESTSNGGSSPEKNVYSSIANSLAEDGTLSFLSEEELKEVKDSETLLAAMKKQQEYMLDDTQKRVEKALNAGLQPSEIQQYENLISQLNTVKEEDLNAETTEGENLRKTIILNYHLNLGMSEERARKMVERAFAGGTDIDDAKEYLETLKTDYQNKYEELIENGNKRVQEAKKKQEEDLKKIKDTLLKDSKVLGDIEIDARTRQLALDNWMKPTYRNKDGVYQSKIQKYIAENPTDFQMKVALLFTLTDGFEKMGNVLKQTAKKEKRKALEELEHVINNTQRTPSGVLNLDGGEPKGMLHIAPMNEW